MYEFFQAGDVIDYTPTEDTDAGVIVDVGGGLLGITTVPIKKDRIGGVQIGGVYLVDPGGVVLSVGDDVRVNLATQAVVGADETIVGKCYYVRDDGRVGFLLNNRTL